MIWRADYSAHEVFVGPARQHAALWRFAAGFVLAAFAYLALNQVFFQMVDAVVGDQRDSFRDALISGTTPLTMYLLLGSFAFMIAGVGLSVRVLHNRPVLSLLGPIPRLLRDFRAVSVAMICVGVAVAVLPPWDMGGELVPNLPIGLWVMLLPVSMLAVLLQVSAEEIVFRGYVQQQLAARFKSPLVWMVLPSVAFALGHYLPEAAGENALLIAVWAGLFGMLMADLTARSGSLGPAIAVHFWNNMSAMLIISLPDELSGLALFTSPFAMGDGEAMRAWLPVDFALMLVSWLAARLAIRR